jgi:tetratricopeptide (TPR) repeat protein
MASRENNGAMEEKSLRTAVALCSDLPRAHFAMGRYLNERDEYRQAMQAFQKAAEIEPGWTQAHLSAADAACACNEFQAALQALRKAVDLAPDNPEPLWSLGVFYDEHLKLPESARRTFDAFVTQFEDDPRVSEARERLRTLDTIPVAASTSPALATAENTPGAGGSSSNLQHEIVHVALPGPGPKAVHVVVPEVKSQREKAVNLFNEGARQQAIGDHDKAVWAYQQAIDADPGYAPIYYNLGLIYHQRKQLENARNAYMKATECDEKLVDAHFNLALICRDLGDEARARNELEQVLSQRPDHALSHFVLGKIYAGQTGKAIDARRYYSRFLALAPNDPVAPEARRWLLQN